MTTRHIPHHRLPVKLANTLIGSARALGLKRRPFDPDRMMTWAKRMTGLEDFGDPSFEVPFRLLLEDINDDDDIHEMGRVFHKIYLSGFLRNRLRLAQALKQQPQVLEQTIRPPLVILGLPRTATTRLFNILSGSPDLRTLSYWEAESPVPGPLEDWLPFNPRRVNARMLLAAANYLAPELKTIHELLLDGPEECIHLLANSFSSWIFPVEYNAPRYVKWFDKTDHLQAYAEYKTQLQLLQSQRPAGTRLDRWLLKTPHHLFGIEALLKTFPGAMIIQTHRDPAKVVPSFCSLSQTTRGIACNSIDPEQLGAQMSDQMALSLARAAEFRSQIPASQIIDIHFQEIVADPLAVVERIYDTFGLDLDLATRKGVQSEIDTKTLNKHGRHHYTLEQFGLNQDLINEKFGAYYETFNVIRET